MITRFFKKLYRIFDKILIVPISRFVYYLSKKLKKGQGGIDKILNRPHVLIYLSLIAAVIFFILIDSKVINFVESEAEVITNVPVLVKYNEEAYVVEGVPETVDITVTGRKSDIYLAKQLGEYQVILDLSDYKSSNAARKVYFTYSKSINSLTYKLDPSYVQVTIKNKESQRKLLTYEVLNRDALGNKLSIDSITLKDTEAVVKGGSDTLEKVAVVKALIDFKKYNFTDKGTNTVDDVELVAYDSNGNRMNNVEIVPKTISAEIVLDSYSTAVPLKIKTTGDLVAGKAIASIVINKNVSYSPNGGGFNINIYGEKSKIDNIKEIPVTLDVNGAGNESVKRNNVKINRPEGVNSMSTDTISIDLTFGEEVQKTFDISAVAFKNLASGLVANSVGNATITVQAKGVQSVIDSLSENDINAYVDLSGINATNKGETIPVEVKIDNTNPFVTFVVSGKLDIAITGE